MTANERLYAAGLLAQFDTAVRARNKAAVIACLTAVEIEASEATKIVDAVFSHPDRYGF
jgi:hypothetical protein